jgi:CHAT domain-containing protein
MRIFSSLLVLCFSCHFAFAQNHKAEIRKADSLISVTQYDQAEAILNTWATRGTEFEKAITQTSKGFLYLNKGRYDLALENLQQALNRFQTSGKKGTPEEAKCLSTIGLVYGSTRKYKQAEENHLMALQIREKIFGKDSEEVAASNNDLGLIYFETDPDKSLEYLDKALLTYKKIHGDNHPKIAIASTNIGFAYRKLGLFGDAIVNFENANKLWEKIYPNGHPNQALVLSYLGQTYSLMNDNKTALGYFEKSLALYKKSYGEKHPDIANAYNQLGILKLNEQNFKEALVNFQKAIIANVPYNIPYFSSEDLKRNPSIKEYYNGNGLLYSLRYKAKSLESQYYGETLKRDNLELALSCLHTCDSLIDDIRQNSSDESDKMALGEIANEVYEDAVRIAHAMSEVTFDARPLMEKAFYFAEKSKSAVLQESIADAQAKSFSGIPSALLEEEKNLKSTITLLNQKLSLKPDPTEEKKLREELFSLNQKYHAFIKRLEKEFPNYFNLKFNQSTPTVAELQSSLNEETGILSFFVAEESKRVYQFIITRKQFKINNLTMPEDFDKLVRGFNNSLLYSDFDTYKRSSLALAKVLIPKLNSSITRIIVVPSGRLGTLPFEALPLNTKKHVDFKGTEYLVNKYAVSYEFSTTLMVQMNGVSARTGEASIYLCAPVKFPEKDNLSELPGTEAEVNTIAGLFGKTAHVAKFQDANETSIKKSDLSNYNYLHFATHGIVDESEPELSRIFLNGSKQDDGNLFSGEIFNLQLKADLAVLSACQTGLGKFSKGEGVIGLSRALTYAGAKSLIVSFWSVSDESTAELMTAFYKTILQNKTENLPSALRQAKLQLIKDDKFSAPYYWAPFILIGD